MDRRPEALPSGDPAAVKGEIASAAQVLQALVKADRGFSIYLPNNPLHEKFFEDFRQRVAEHLEEFGPLRLDIAHDSILCRGEPVYANPELRENLAFRMFADGIRSISLAEGIEAHELRTLVEIFGRQAMEEDEDDIVTRLWSSELPHLSYVLSELPLASEPEALGLRGTQTVQEEALRHYAAELAAAPPPPLPPLPPQQIFSLTEEELIALQSLLAGEEQRRPLEDLAGILEAVLAAEEEDAVLEEFLEIITRLCADLLITRRIEHSVALISVLTRVEARPGLPEGRAAKLAGARAGVLSSSVVEGLSRLLAGGEGIERELLWRLVVTLGRPAIEPFCRILGDVPGKEMRKVLIEALAETGRGAPELFLPFLRDPRWYLVRNTIYILRRIGGPEAARAVLQCAGNRDLRVRKEVLFYFDETGDSVGETALLAFLGDEAQALRMAAARSLARRGSRAAAQRLLALTVSPGFAACELVERETVWEALGALSPAEVFPRLKKLLLKRHWFGQAGDLEDTVCAVAGLKRIGSPGALEVLREAAGRKRGAALEIVRKALQTLAAGRGADGKPAGQGEGAARG